MPGMPVGQHLVCASPISRLWEASILRVSSRLARASLVRGGGVWRCCWPPSAGAMAHMPVMFGALARAGAAVNITAETAANVRIARKDMGLHPQGSSSC